MAKFCWFFWVMMGVIPANGLADAYDAPPGYYALANGRGPVLAEQLARIMSTGHVQRTYGSFRQSAAVTDRAAGEAGRVLLVYDRATVAAAWDQGDTWNREHVWPQSLQPGKAKNGTAGNLGDPLGLRPSHPAINSRRGNKPFGSRDTSGGHRRVGAYYFPGDADKGDIARSLFYSATRWRNLGLVLVDGTPSGNQMGDLAALLRWHYTDPPDAFERRRNHVIFSQRLNPSYYTNNRNAFIDHPEFAWSVFGGDDNDSVIRVGETAEVSGASRVLVDLGRVLVGGSLPAAREVALIKEGEHPTYYAVRARGAAVSPDEGRLHAFDFGRQEAVVRVALEAAAVETGWLSGTIVIDNLDVSSGGAGRGAADGDDVIEVRAQVVEHAVPSLVANAVVRKRTVAEKVVGGGGVVRLAVPVYNIGPDQPRAEIEVVEIEGLTPPFAWTGVEEAGADSAAQVVALRFDPDGLEVGRQECLAGIIVRDRDVPGARSSRLEVVLQIEVTRGATVPADSSRWLLLCVVTVGVLVAVLLGRR